MERSKKVSINQAAKITNVLTVVVASAVSYIHVSIHSNIPSMYASLPALSSSPPLRSSKLESLKLAVAQIEARDACVVYLCCSVASMA